MVRRQTASTANRERLLQRAEEIERESRELCDKYRELAREYDLINRKLQKLTPSTKT
jgi:hypothetical protein